MTRGCPGGSSSAKRQQLAPFAIADAGLHGLFKLVYGVDDRQGGVTRQKRRGVAGRDGSEAEGSARWFILAEPNTLCAAVRGSVRAERNQL